MKRIILIILTALMAFGTCSAATRQKKVKETREVTFLVTLHCENCVKKVMENVSFEKGLKDIDVSLEKQQVKLKFDPAKTSEEKLKQSIEKLGYPVLGKVVAGEDTKQ